MGGVVAGDEMLSNVSTVVADLDGVIYVEREEVPGAGRALRALDDAGVRLLFVTNNSMKTRAAAAETITATTGFAADPDAIVTSAMATAAHIRGRYRAAFLLGGAGLADELSRIGIELVEDWRQAEVVVVGLDRELTYDRLAAATLAVRSGAAYVASNLDATYPTGEGLHPGGGAIAAALTAASGREPVVCGKPHDPIRDLVRSRVGPGGVLVVGDRPDTDIAIAVAEGWPSALVLTGVVSDPTSVPAEHAPTTIVDSMADIPALLGID